MAKIQYGAKPDIFKHAHIEVPLPSLERLGRCCAAGRRLRDGRTAPPDGVVCTTRGHQVWYLASGQAPRPSSRLHRHFPSMGGLHCIVSNTEGVSMRTPAARTTYVKRMPRVHTNEVNRVTKNKPPRDSTMVQSLCVVLSDKIEVRRSPSVFLLNCLSVLYLCCSALLSRQSVDVQTAFHTVQCCVSVPRVRAQRTC